MRRDTGLAKSATWLQFDYPLMSAVVGATPPDLTGAFEMEAGRILRAADEADNRFHGPCGREVIEREIERRTAEPVPLLVILSWAYLLDIDHDLYAEDLLRCIASLPEHPVGLPVLTRAWGRLLHQMSRQYDLPDTEAGGRRGLLLYQAGIGWEDAPAWADVPDDDLLVMASLLTQPK